MFEIRTNSNNYCISIIISMRHYKVVSIFDNKDSYLACLDGAEISASGLKIGRSPVQISPKTNFSIMIKVTS